MSEHEIPVPTIAMIAGTRVALGAGIGLLLSNRLSWDGRRAAGWALTTFGVLTTIPLVATVIMERYESHSSHGCEA